jgi:hypothetical protein
VVKPDEFFIRTEDIKTDEVLNFFAETSRDRTIIEAIKDRSPVLLVGSRGVGKSFLLKVAQAELLRDFQKNRILPVYISFTKSSLLQGATEARFQDWMLSKICTEIIRALSKQGVLTILPQSLSVLAGEHISVEIKKSKIEQIADALENSWRAPSKEIETNTLPDVDSLKAAIEDICSELNIKRIAVLIDEAAHIFLPGQQRRFFTLFRDLRTPYITCNAAVYPGVTYYGDTFQPSHDATVISVDRDVSNPDYIENMREIVEKQASSLQLQRIQLNLNNFSILAFAASGNPRVLLKTLQKSPKLNSGEIANILREFYRDEIWMEHSLLANRYPGHKTVIDWGRVFIESYVLPGIKQKNDSYLKSDKKTTCFFWVHRDCPESVKQALRVLAYTGMVVEHSQGVRATRAETGTRYLVNLGCLLALESSTNTAIESLLLIPRNLTAKRMTEFGPNHVAFKDIANINPTLDDEAIQRQTLSTQLLKDIDVLDLTDWQKEKLRELNLLNVGAVLNASEQDLQQAWGIGEVKSRRMRNAAMAAVFEYLSG